MIWLTLRQHRTEILLFAGLTTIVGIVLLITGVDMHHAFQQSGAAACIANRNAYNDCGDIINAWENSYESLQNNVNWLSVLPALFGVLFGVPMLAREYEQRTNLLAWTQSVTKRQWLLIKIGVLFLLTFAFSAVVSLIMTWWNGPFDLAYGRFAQQSFDFEGIAFYGYAAFSLAFGLAAGALLRRVVPAIAVALIGFLPFRLWIGFSVRPNYMAPIMASIAPTGPDLSSLNWKLSEYWSDAAGHPIPPLTFIQTCGSLTNKISALQCIQSHGWFDTIIYQPISRYWPFQFIEFGIFFGLALALTGFTIWWAGYHSTN